jgi:HEPN domain-containing protein
MKAHTREWLRKAERDRFVANDLIAKKPRVHDIVCFHCQQAVKKLLKALLVEQGQSVPKVHDLLKLVALAAERDPTVTGLHRVVNELTEFAVEY